MLESRFHPSANGGLWGYHWALYRSKDNPAQRYIHMNLHFFYNNNEDQLPEIRETHHELVHLRRMYPKVPIFVTGDFNAQPGTVTFETTFADTGLVTANRDMTAIDHVAYDESLLTRKQGMFINNGWIAKTSDHRPFFADFSRG